MRWVEVVFVQGGVVLGKEEGDGPLSERVFLFGPHEVLSPDEIEKAERIFLREQISSALRGIADIEALRQALAILRAATSAQAAP